MLLKIKEILSNAKSYNSHNLPILLCEHSCGNCDVVFNSISDRISLASQYLNQKSMALSEVLDTIKDLNEENPKSFRVENYVIVIKDIENYKIFKIESIDISNPWTIVDEKIIKYFVNGINYLTLY